MSIGPSKKNICHLEIQSEIYYLFYYQIPVFFLSSVGFEPTTVQAILELLITSPMLFSSSIKDSFLILFVFFYNFTLTALK